MSYSNIPSFSDSDAVWIEWHKDTKKRFGKENANTLFLQAVSENRMNNETANTYALRSYAKSQGMDIEGAYLGSGIYDYASSTIDATGAGFNNIGNFVLVGVLIVAGILIFGLVKMYK